MNSWHFPLWKWDPPIFNEYIFIYVFLQCTKTYKFQQFDDNRSNSFYTRHDGTINFSLSLKTTSSYFVIYCNLLTNFGIKSVRTGKDKTLSSVIMWMFWLLFDIDKLSVRIYLSYDDSLVYVLLLNSYLWLISNIHVKHLGDPIFWLKSSSHDKKPRTEFTLWQK